MGTNNNAPWLVWFRLLRDCVNIFRYTKAFYPRRTGDTPSAHTGGLPPSATIQRFACGGHNSGQQRVGRSSIPHASTMPFAPSDYFALPPKARAGLCATLRAQPGLCAPEQNNRNSFQRDGWFSSPPQTLFTFLTSLSLRSPLLLKNQTPPILRDYLAAQQHHYSQTL